ncbi:25S rRNA (adenine2142-N1)-methyltransferase [Coemansia erecta]|nr:25S rRNA (adenine2142-N1)-methyltransferase [Coemansia sp. RSA 2618]KAJ2829911.1 25S rRNA (adenine2142-N1)-methyltransferase [Coemansia erecta]
MPKTHSKRRRPVTAQHSTSTPVASTLPPIHVAGQDKIIVDTNSLSTVARGKLGKSSTDTRRRINHFHTLIKEYSKLGAKRSQTSDPQETFAIDERINAVSQEMAQMGGLDWYQKASLLGQSKQRGGDTSRWLIPKLCERGLDKQKTKLRLLDVGALSCLNYAKERAWIDVTPIDLNSQEPGIFQQDFLDIVLGTAQCSAPGSDRDSDDNDDVDDDDGDSSGEPTANASHLFQLPFDVVCLSLVVNFIGDPVKRGDMLQQAARLLAPGGYLFLVLPLSCVENSRYLDDERLLAIMTHLRFEQLSFHHTAKLAHYFYQLSKTAIAKPPSDANYPHKHTYPKKLLHPGGGRNNFSIVV